MSTATAARVPPTTAMPSSTMAPRVSSVISQKNPDSSTMATRRTGLMSVSPVTRPFTTHSGQAMIMVTSVTCQGRPKTAWPQRPMARAADTPTMPNTKARLAGDR